MTDSNLPPSKAANVLEAVNAWAASVTRKPVVAPVDNTVVTRNPAASQTPTQRLEGQIADLDKLFVYLSRLAVQAGDVHQTDMLLKLALACNRGMTRAVATLAEIQGKRPPPVVDLQDVDIGAQTLP